MTLTFPAIPTGFTGTTYTRFRLSTDAAGQNSTGAATDGEVEDYVFTITAAADQPVTVASFLKIASDTNGGPALAVSDRFGDSVASVGDLDGDGVADLAVGAYGDDTGGSSRGAVHMLLLNSNGTVKSSTKIAGGTNGGPALVNGDYFGRSVASVGDLNGDGVADLAIGAYGDNTGGSNRGAVHVLFLKPVSTDTTAPSLTSFTRQTPASSPTNADTLVFRATFSEAVTNVDTTDFAVNGSTTATVTSVDSADSGAGLLWDLTVSGGDLASFTGTVGLNLSGTQNITDLAGNALPTTEPTTDDTYTVGSSRKLMGSFGWCGVCWKRGS